MAVTTPSNGRPLPVAALAAPSLGPPVNVVALPGPVNIWIYAGDDFVLRLQMFDTNNNPIDMTGSTVRSHIRETVDGPLVAEWESCGTQDNNVFIRLDTTITTDLPTDTVYDVEITRPEMKIGNCLYPHISTYIAGSINVSPEVTHDNPPTAPTGPTGP